MNPIPELYSNPDAKPAAPVALAEQESEIPLHSPIDNKLIGFLLEHQVAELIRHKRATLVRDRKGVVRRAYLRLYPGDENNPVIWDLMNRMCAGRKEIQREIVNASEHHWVWNHKLRGRKRFEAFAEIMNAERRGLIKQMRRRRRCTVRSSRCRKRMGATR